VAGEVNTYTHNSCYEFHGLSTNDGTEAKEVALSCWTDSISQFVSHYAVLTLPQLRAISVVHHLGGLPRKPAMLQELICHRCSDECPGQSRYLLFSKRTHRRNSPFKIIEEVAQPAALDDDVPTIGSMDNLGIMPLVFMNEILVDMEDGTQFCSTYLLNKEFKFAETVTTLTLSHIYLVNMDVKYVAVHTIKLAALVTFFIFRSNILLCS
jgi:hypothetical protein